MAATGPCPSRLPSGTIVNSEFPAGVNARMVTVHRIGDTVLGAMAKAAPELFTAAGCGQTSVIPVGGSDAAGNRFVGVLGGPYRGGMGARPDKDGIDVTDHDICNVYHVPIEMTEGELPVRYKRLELWRDSGGAGTWRGGLGYRAELEWLAHRGTVSLRRERHKFGPLGRGRRRRRPGVPNRHRARRRNPGRASRKDPGRHRARRRAALLDHGRRRSRPAAAAGAATGAGRCARWPSIQESSARHLWRRPGEQRQGGLGGNGQVAANELILSHQALH